MDRPADAMGCGAGKSAVPVADLPEELDDELSLPTPRAGADVDIGPALAPAELEGPAEELVLPPGIKACPACGMLIEKIGGNNEVFCGCVGRRAGGTYEKALEGGGCGHEFDFDTLRPLSCGKPGEPANDKQRFFIADPVKAVPAKKGKKGSSKPRSKRGKPTGQESTIPFPNAPVASSKLELPPGIKECPACGMLIEKIDGDAQVMCGCEARPAGGNYEKALAGGGCGHEFHFDTLNPIGCGKPGEPANDRQKFFRPRPKTCPTDAGAGRMPFAENLEKGDREPPAEALAAPPYWTNALATDSFHQLEDVADEEQDIIQELMTATYKDIPTRDREGRMARHFEVLDVKRIEASNQWKPYANRVHNLKLKRRNAKPIEEISQGGPIETSEVSSRLPARLNKEINEAYFWHGSSPAGINGIVGSGFRLAFANCTLFHTGLYFAEASTKSDEYAREGTRYPHGEVCAVLLCRVAMGQPALFLQGGDDERNNIEEMVGSDQFDSVLGDREACVGTYREFIVYREDQCYPEYLVFYRRKF